MEMRIHWIWLAHRPSLTDKGKIALLQHFSDPEKIYYADDGAYDAVDSLSPEAKRSLRDKDLAEAEAILEVCDRQGLTVLTHQDAAYPRSLRNTPDSPVVLYCKGHLPELDALPVIGVVGTRRASAYGMATAKRLGYQIARCGGIVVSGLASGIDAMAMTGALLAGRRTIGVLGCGVDVVYPLSNRSLFRDVEANGCLLSEFPPGTPPMKWHFPRRNRIISGLSDGVLVVEAPERSGALITARLAADQGRDVFAVPGNIDQPSCIGSNHLLRDGAIMVSSGWDVVCEYQALYPDKIRREDPLLPEESPLQGREKPLTRVAQTPRIPAKSENLKEIFNNKTIDKPGFQAYSDGKEAPRPRNVTPEEQKLLDVLGTEERLVDDVIAETGLSTGKVLASLTMLELKGLIRRLPGKRIALKK